MNRSARSFLETLDSVVPGLLENYRISGLAVNLIEQNQVSEYRYYGYANKASKIPLCASTVFQAASVSKPVTAWGIIKLFEYEKISIDQTISYFLKKKLYKGINPDISIRQLLNHTSGLSVQSYPGYRLSTNTPTLEQVLSGRLKGVPPAISLSAPGESFLYTGAGYLLLQLILETITQESFSNYMHREILLPLNMERSSFEYDFEVSLKLARTYNFVGFPMPAYHYVERAAAGLYTTVSDMGNFIKSNFIDNTDFRNNIISSDNLNLMHQQLGRNLSGSLGFFVSKSKKGRKTVFHSGYNRGWCSHISFIPNEGSGIVLLSNSDIGKFIIKDVLVLWKQWMEDGTSLNLDAFVKIKMKHYANVCKHLLATRGRYYTHYLMRLIKEK
ncbi:hypothetical protein A3842_07880 [Paenibacillus sp. P3E]|uniref:serine hydrolase domain-containing protein n=1 Tax=Paenibacillus sp. P3E TaxID=1349435 RepID=UPI00093EAFE3|nr:serine hydrolase domain-containing protein [Paenibacillus sp. P3E]OKP84769.1 hypothetical protein A3842_07880 [Paenibacillus sp. P3E]